MEHHQLSQKLEPILKEAENWAGYIQQTFGENINSFKNTQTSFEQGANFVIEKIEDRLERIDSLEQLKNEIRSGHLFN